MLEQIQEIVRKNLPAEVGDQLRQYMKDAESWNSSMKRLEREVADHKAKLAERDAEIADLKKQLAKAGSLTERERIVGERENKLAVTLAEAKAAEAEKRSDGIYQLAAMVFRNPVFKSREFGNTSHPPSQYSGGSATSGSESKDKETTVE